MPKLKFIILFSVLIAFTVALLGLAGYQISNVKKSNETAFEAIGTDLALISEFDLFTTIASDSTINYINDLELDFIVILGYLTGEPIPCLGAYIGTTSIISTNSCLQSYRKYGLNAVIGFNNTPEYIKITGYEKNFDYVSSNKADADIIYFTLEHSSQSHPIQLEINVDRPLSNYTNEPYRLYRISVHRKYDPQIVVVRAEEIKDCGRSIYCLELNDSESSIGSFLVAQTNDEYLLLGMQQNRTLENNLTPFTKLPLYATWIKSKQS